ncbi:hypothetical protein BN903_5 [Halorubrum sp. AJ67]|nr:hypothetical protein BN903_5 [Halorubrum sp. AJ67]
MTTTPKWTGNRQFLELIQLNELRRLIQTRLSLLRLKQGLSSQTLKTLT